MQKYIHIKTGNSYTKLFDGKAEISENNWQPSIIYQSDSTKEVFVRTSEIFNSKFKMVEENV